MVGRIRLTFWRLLAKIHDELHAVRGREISETFHVKHDPDAAHIERAYVSPSVHYLGTSNTTATNGNG